MKHLSIFLLASIALYGTSSAQAPVKQWDSVYGGNGYDNLRVILKTADGGYAFLGRSGSTISGNKTSSHYGTFNDQPDHWFIKLDANFSKQWENVYGNFKEENLTCAQQTTDGGYILGSWAHCAIGGDHSEDSWSAQPDYWIIKIDAVGTKQWDKRFGGDKEDYLVSLQQTSDGGYIFGGYSQTDLSGDHTVKGHGQKDYWIVKTDANGNKQWDSSYGGVKDEILATVFQTSDGGYILGGYSSSPISGDKSQASRGVIDYWIIKLDANRNIEWQKTSR